MHRPSFMPAPAPVLRLVLGEMAGGMLLASQRAVPRRLEGQGFTFEYPQARASVEKALS
jgi:NAD dependent epimerase/dehydratase family enzyme